MSTYTAIPFITLKKVGGKRVAFELNEEACTLLASGLKGPIVPIVFCGPYRSGKSWFAGRFANHLYTLTKQCNDKSKTPNFQCKVGNTANACTMGIFMIPFVFEIPIGDVTHHVVIFDCEGLASTGSGTEHASEDYDNRLLCLTILLGKNVIYNTMGSITQPHLITLNNGLMKAKEVCNMERESMEAPNFIWVLRDFIFQDMKPDDYLQDRLTNNSEPELVKNIRDVLPHRSCVCFPSPLTGDMIATQLEQVPFRSLCRPFREQFEGFINMMLQRLAPKQICGRDVSGAVYIHMVRQYIQAINSDKLPEIRSSFQAQSELQCRDAKDQAMEMLVAWKRSKTENKRAVIKLKELDKEVQEVLQQILKKYSSMAYGPAAEVIQKRLQDDVTDQLNTISKELINTIEQQHAQFVRIIDEQFRQNKPWEEIEKGLLYAFRLCQEKFDDPVFELWGRALCKPGEMPPAKKPEKTEIVGTVEEQSSTDETHPHNNMRRMMVWFQMIVNNYTNQAKQFQQQVEEMSKQVFEIQESTKKELEEKDREKEECIAKVRNEHLQTITSLEQKTSTLDAQYQQVLEGYNKATDELAALRAMQTVQSSTDMWFDERKVLMDESEKLRDELVRIQQVNAELQAQQQEESHMKKDLEEARAALRQEQKKYFENEQKWKSQFGENETQLRNAHQQVSTVRNEEQAKWQKKISDLEDQVKRKQLEFEQHTMDQKNKIQQLQFQLDNALDQLKKVDAYRITFEKEQEKARGVEERTRQEYKQHIDVLTNQYNDVMRQQHESNMAREKIITTQLMELKQDFARSKAEADTYKTFNDTLKRHLTSLDEENRTYKKQKTEADQIRIEMVRLQRDLEFLRGNQEEKDAKIQTLEQEKVVLEKKLHDAELDYQRRVTEYYQQQQPSQGQYF